MQSGVKWSWVILRPSGPSCTPRNPSGRRGEYRLVSGPPPPPPQGLPQGPSAERCPVPDWPPRPPRSCNHPTRWGDVWHRQAPPGALRRLRRLYRGTRRGPDSRPPVLLFLFLRLAWGGISVPPRPPPAEPAGSGGSLLTGWVFPACGTARPSTAPGGLSDTARHPSGHYAALDARTAGPPRAPTPSVAGSKIFCIIIIYFPRLREHFGAPLAVPSRLGGGSPRQLNERTTSRVYHSGWAPASLEALCLGARTKEWVFPARGTTRPPAVRGGCLGHLSTFPCCNAASTALGRTTPRALALLLDRLEGWAPPPSSTRGFPRPGTSPDPGGDRIPRRV